MTTSPPSSSPSARPAVTTLAGWAAAIDAQDWDAVAGHLAPGFRCRFVHTGESLDGPGFVAFNRDYPSSWRFEPEEIVDAGHRAVLRARVSNADETYYVASFATVDDAGLLTELVEVWTSAVAAAPPERRPSESGSS